MKKVFDYILLAIKGALFGIANLIPGVSGGTIAIVTGVYNKLLDAINHIFSKKFLKSFIFLLIFLVGAVLAVIFGSKGITYCIENYPIYTSCVFIGLMLGGLPLLHKKVKDNKSIKGVIILIIALLLVCGLTFIPVPPITNHENLQIYEYFILAGLGFLASVAMIIPGISGMMFFKIFGYYGDFNQVLANITKFDMLGQNILFLLPIGIGILVGLFTAAKVFSIILKKFPVMSYYAIIGFVLGSVLVLIKDNNVINGIAMGGILSSFETMIETNFLFFIENYLTVIISVGLIVVAFILICLLGFISNKIDDESMKLSNEVTPDGSQGNSW